MKLQISLILAIASSSCQNSVALGLRRLANGNSGSLFGNQGVECGDVRCNPSEVCNTAINVCIKPSECATESMCVMMDLDEGNKQCMVAYVDCMQNYTCYDDKGCVAD